MPDQQFSLLSGEEIKSAGIVIDGQDDLYRAATYDLSIGEIIPGDPMAVSASISSAYTLSPGGMVRVVSHESLRLPADITGHVLLKNGLCGKGVLAINIGIADPGFEGPLSSTLINFGRGNYVVKKGVSFLRVSFHRCPPSGKAMDSKKLDRTQYLERVKEEVLAYSGPTFLNMEETVAKAAHGAFGSFKKWLLLWVAVAAVALAFVTILVPLGASYADRYIAGRDRRDEETRRSLERKFDEQYAARFKTLSDQIEELRRAAPKPANRVAPSRRQ